MSVYKYGICEWLMPVTGPAAITLAGEMGFDGVQILDSGGESQNFPMNNPRVQDIYKKAADKAGIDIQTYQLQSLVRSGKVKSPQDSQGFRDAVLAIKKGIKVCRAIGIKNLMMENFFDSFIYNDYDLENTGALLKVAGELTGEAGIQLIYESFVSVEKTLRLYEMANRSFKLCYDTLNPQKYDFGDPLDELRRYPLAIIDHIHFKDTAPNYTCSALLGRGSSQFKRSVELLREIGYTGWLVTENYYCEGAFGRENDPFESIQTDLDTMRERFRS